MFEKGLFGRAFDLNGDGKLDAFERALEFQTFTEMNEADEKSSDRLFENNFARDYAVFEDEFDGDEDDFDEFDEDFDCDCDGFDF